MAVERMREREREKGTNDDVFKNCLSNKTKKTTTK